ncbi:16S rRNA (cytosine(1402)-N(4))-methyltransferase RsmH [Nesterenkonia natronophila]|uniref:Ribosomal RNA small subunit methyltransferase H n=1 Tax=Nesterenkonia natronophila TaxID=2174932 RepID=A0A3A4F566_9MICC|nr:16S rRNA (cytosine(1402)-N(4))-methyltransferase RsmH [Nesterenkonia natronophila]RJN33263.1 16S rRNA (cytosine(1402)-N(4))-methyltransferase RsmH [Nesterenkonia natronophila]
MSTQPAANRHVPVMVRRCTELLAEACRRVSAGQVPVVIDATLGMGGHTEALLSEVPEATVIGIDRDPQALDLAARRLERFGPRFRPVRTVYDSVNQVAAELQDGETLAGVLFDLGVSSLQLDEAERGFAYSYDAPLDMRMDAAADSADPTAAELIAEISESELKRILSEYGEERYSGRIASAIVRERQSAPLRTTAQLAAVIDAAVPASSKRTGGHPAKRSFQAIRIAVNRELEVLTRAVPAAMDAVAIGGVVVVLSYHSLEDRIVKRAFVTRTKSSAPAGLPVELEEHKPTFEPLVRGAVPPSAAEISANPRAASAKLRAVRKTRTQARNTV